VFFLERTNEDLNLDSIEVALKGLKLLDPYIAINREAMEKCKDRTTPFITGYLKGYIQAGNIICNESSFPDMTLGRAQKLKLEHFILKI
jgi:hypothetical protein